MIFWHSWVVSSSMGVLQKNWSSEPSNIGSEGRFSSKICPGRARSGPSEPPRKSESSTWDPTQGRFSVKIDPHIRYLMVLTTNFFGVHPYYSILLRNAKKSCLSTIWRCVRAKFRFWTKRKFYFSQAKFPSKLPQSALRPQILTFDPHILGYLPIFDTRKFAHICKKICWFRKSQNQ